MRRKEEEISIYILTKCGLALLKGTIPTGISNRRWRFAAFLKFYSSLRRLRRVAVGVETFPCYISDIMRHNIYLGRSVLTPRSQHNTKIIDRHTTKQIFFLFSKKIKVGALLYMI